MTRTLIPAFALLALVGVPARAAPTMPAVSMPSALAPATLPHAFRHIAANGTTKPAGAVLDDRGGLTPALREREREIQRLVATTICRGC